jgi:hypothetical protein
MNPILKNALAVLAGFAAGFVAHMALLYLGMSIIPGPEGLDPMNEQSVIDNAHLLTGKHFIFPFLAHAGGALVSGIVAAKLAANNGMRLALGLGVFWLLGGIMNLMNVPHPTWFAILDIAAAYIPMAWLGGKIGLGKQ